MTKSKVILYFFIVSIFMLANGSFFNWVFAHVGFRVWRQAIFFMGLFILLFDIKSFKGFRSIITPFWKLWAFVIIFSLITLLVNGFSPMRVLYANWIYFSGLPFLLCIPYMFRCGWSKKKICYFFIGLGVFQTIGLFVDFSTGGIITAFFQGAGKGDGRTAMDIMEIGRYSFLSEAPTTFGIYYCLCMTMCFYQIIQEKKLLAIIILYVIGVTFIIGAWLTASRQLVAILLMVFLLDSFIVFFKNRKFRLSTVPILLVFVALSASVLSFLYSDDALSSRYTIDSIQGDTRSELWHKGWEECVFSPSFRRLTIGDGVGYVDGNFAGKFEAIGSHYENTFFARISEIGLILGLITLMLPIIIMIKNGRHSKDFGNLYLPVCFAYLFICYISPNGAATTTQMSIFILLGLVVYNKKIISNQ